MESTKELYSVVRSLGEDVSITQTINNVATVINAKMSVVPAARANYNLVDRAFLLSGSLALDIGDNYPAIEGSYITRAIEPNSKYLVYSKAIDAGYSAYLSDIFCSKCTDIIKIKRKAKTYDSWGNVLETYNDIATNVYACCNTAPRPLKITADGKIDQSLHGMVIPARYGLSKGDRIVKTGFVNGVLKEMVYEVDSVETSLVEHDSSNNIYGIAQYQIVYIEDVLPSTYTLSTSLSHCTATQSVTEISTQQYLFLEFTANTGYSLPLTITVSNADYVWDNTQGKLMVYNPTGNVAITITANANT
jgi:hypothetical protein